MLFCISIYRLKHTKFIDMFIWEMKFLFWEASHQKTSLVWNEESPNFLAVLICLLLFISLSTWLFHVEFIFAKKNHKITEHRLSSLSRSFRRLYHVWRATFLQRFFSLTSLYYFIMIIYFHFFLNCPISFITLHDLRTQTQFCNHWSHRL